MLHTATRSESPAAQALDCLCQNGDLRIWSVIVSIFGDLAPNCDDQISGALLSRLTLPMGIRAEALRVALFRLRKDGWLTSQKFGRTSAYQLTSKGLSESQSVRQRIYGPQLAAPKTWHLAIGPTPPQDEGAYLNIAPNVYLGQGSTARTQQNCLILTGHIDTIPDWLQHQIMPDNLMKKYQALEITLRQVSEILATAPSLDPLERVCLRVLIVHNWRRLLLRHEALPEIFYPQNWRGVACRKQVDELLAIYERPALDQLHNQVNI